LGAAGASGVAEAVAAEKIGRKEAPDDEVCQKWPWEEAVQVGTPTGTCRLAVSAWPRPPRRKNPSFKRFTQRRLGVYFNRLGTQNGNSG
jgi:hypothetical protein